MIDDPILAFLDVVASRRGDVANEGLLLGALRGVIELCEIKEDVYSAVGRDPAEAWAMDEELAALTGGDTSP